MTAKPKGSRQPRQSSKPGHKAGLSRDTASMPGLDARMAAVRLLGAVVDARTSLDGLTDNQHGHPNYLALDGRDRSLVRAILASALRHRGTIEALISARLDRALPENARSLRHILHVGAAQMLFLDIPDSAAVDLAVSHARADPRNARFAPLVNAVLREIGRRKARALPAALRDSVDVPDWFLARLEGAYGGERTAEILAAQRVEAPVDFTVKEDPAVWAERLGGIVLPTGSVRVARPGAPIVELPGYAEGLWWIQDAAAALPARLMGDVRGKRVLDLCAAPGGKTAQLAHAGAHVTAVEKSRNRMKRLAVNLERLKLSAELIETDALGYESASRFDAILLDAPCSSTGTVRRHPDVPWTKSMDDVQKLAGLQRAMLDHAVSLVREGGKVVFANCSLDPMEGEQMIEAFLAETPSMRIDPVRPGEVDGLDGLVNASGALRTTPADMKHADPTLSGCDGFFAVRLVRGD